MHPFITASELIQVMLNLPDVAGTEMGFAQQPPQAMPRGPSPAAGFSQPPANQAMMPGFPQPSSGGSPVAAPRSQPAAAAYSQPPPPQPAGKSTIS